MKKAFFQISGIVGIVALLLGSFSNDALASRRHHRSHHYSHSQGHAHSHHHGHRR